MVDVAGFAAKRDRLVALLEEAAELEHAACCMYLFAAFSMKNDPIEGAVSFAELDQLRVWKGTMLSIARMEMEHLAIVNNLLGAIGEAPHFDRPDFPTPPGEFPVDLGLSLQTFSLPALGTFLLFEFPDAATPQEAALVQFLTASPLPADKALLARIGNGRSSEEQSLNALYDEVVSLLSELGQAPDALFVGPPGSQISNTTVFPGFPPNASNIRVYDVLIATVTDTASALAAITQIRQEGEGSVSTSIPAGGHFLRFVQMYEELSLALRANPAFVPGRDVVPNPIPIPPPGFATDPAIPGRTQVTNPTTSETMAIYDLAYDTCLRMLALLFSAPLGIDRRGAVEDAVFFPMMTLVLRPIGDVLTQMPATANGQRRAGPSFQAPRSVGPLPHTDAAWTVLAAQLDEISARAAALAANPGVPPGVAPRVAFFAENAWRIAENFRTTSNLGVVS